MNDIITIIKQQIDRGLKILLSLNDLEEEDGSPLHYRVNLFEGQKGSRWDRYLGMTAAMTQVPV